MYRLASRKRLLPKKNAPQARWNRYSGIRPVRARGPYRHLPRVCQLYYPVNCSPPNSFPHIEFWEKAEGEEHIYDTSLSALRQLTEEDTDVSYWIAAILTERC